MSAWLSSAFQKAVNVTTTNTHPPAPPLPSSLDFIHDPCLTCDNPCETGHPQPPTSLKIDTTLPLNGSIKPYVRHILISAGTGQDWPERIEDLDESSASYISKLQTASREATSKETGRTILTVCDRDPFDVGLFGGGDVEAVGTETIEGVEKTEVLSFPDFVAFPGLSEGEAVDVVNGLIREGKPPNGVERRSLEGKTLVLEVRNVTEEMGLQDKVFCYGVSHFGGHKFAGNLIIYSPAHPYGLWYGRVKTCHIENIIQKTVVEGKVFEELFRGYGTAPPNRVPVSDW
ncbi:Sucrase/ferredoxin-like-domain-containing protein [Chytridium lagenaria]|nr:Sucrase/ferredoxin-like-domain-containing protein [Chytridium lagenaria]